MIVYYETINGITYAVVLNERGEVLYRTKVTMPAKERPESPRPLTLVR